MRGRARGDLGLGEPATTAAPAYEETRAPAFAPLDLSPDLQGRLTETPFRDLVGHLYQQGATGTLTLLPFGDELDDMRIVFASGVPVAAQLPFEVSDLAAGLSLLVDCPNAFLFHVGYDLTDPGCSIEGDVDVYALLDGKEEDAAAGLVVIDDIDQRRATSTPSRTSRPAGSSQPTPVFSVPYPETRPTQPAPPPIAAAAPSPTPRPTPAESLLDLAVPDEVELDDPEAAVTETDWLVSQDVQPEAASPYQTDLGAPLDEAAEEGSGLELAHVDLGRTTEPPPRRESRRPGDFAAARQGYDDARRLLSEGRLDQAIRRLEAVRSLAPEVATYHVALAATLLQRHQGPDLPTARVDAALEDALRADPRCADAHHLKGLVLLDRDRRRALGHLKRAVELDPHHPEAQRDLARAESGDRSLRRLFRGLRGGR